MDNPDFESTAAASGSQQRSDAESERGPELHDAFHQGATDAAHAAATVLPLAGKWLSRSVYGACYMASYGLVFGALTASKLLPPDGPVLRGLQHGADAARKDVEGHVASKTTFGEDTITDVADAG